MTNPVIIELAAELARELEKDISLASTRMEHVRVTARANAARQLLHALGETDSHDTRDGEMTNAGEETLF